MTRSANSQAAEILVIDDHPQAREALAHTLRSLGHGARRCASAREALAALEEKSADCIITDLMMPGMSGLELVCELERRRNETPVLMVTAHATVATAVEAMRHGAFDYLEKPYRVEEIESAVSRALAHGRASARRQSVYYGDAAVQMIGSSRPMQRLREQIAQAAAAEVTVLITGESGTGKELVARSVHAASRRAAGPLVSVNCPALSPQLMESELFGHERGAFTSADASRVGRFELADGGALLLDEVTEIDLPLQAKLLRVLQERTYERVGGSQTHHANVRVLAATNRELRGEVAEGRFREDLYFRLAVAPIQTPPLRERSDDVPELIEHFLGRAAERLEVEPPALDPSVADLLVNYHWPGNVRELENIITRASVFAAGKTVGADDVRPWLLDPEGRQETQSHAVPVGVSLQEMEQRLIEATMEHYNGRRAQTAQALGIGVRTLANKLRSYGYAPRTRAFSGAA